MKKRKHKKTGKCAGNYATPPLDNKVPPAYATFPLTCYQKTERNGQVDWNISEQDVLRLREFNIENKK